MKRRRFTSLLCATALLSFLAAPGAAPAAYPDRPITLVIPLGAGGSHDLHARGVTGIISDILGQPMIVKLLPGGAGMKGTGFVAKAKPDGYTLLFTHNGLDGIVPQVRKVPFDTLKSFKTICRINYAANFFISLPDRPFKTLKGLIAHAKKNPGKVTFGHSGVWGAFHVPALQFIRSAGIKVNFIPHKGGGPALRALLGGQDDIGGAFATQLRPHARAGKVNVLAVTGSSRMKGDPDFANVPSMTELGHPEVSFTMDRIFVAPSGVPEDRMKVLRDAFRKLMGNKSFKRFMRSIGEPVQYMDGPEYDKMRAKNHKAYRQLIKEMTSK